MILWRVTLVVRCEFLEEKHNMLMVNQLDMQTKIIGFQLEGGIRV